MHSRSNQRRQAKQLRRRHVRRRRLVALATVIPPVLLAIWVAYAWPATRPARVPSPSVVSPFSEARGVDRRIVVAKLEGVDVLLPVKIDATTAVAFLPVDTPNCVAFTPVGERGDAGGVSASLSDIFSSGGDMRYYLLPSDSGDTSGPTAGLDVGAVPGVFVYAPVDGRVVSVKDYRLLGRYTDTEIQIRLAGDPSLLLVITHVAKASVAIGADVKAGETPLGVVRGFPSAVQQELHQVTTDAGDHLQLVAIRLPAQLSGL